MKKDQEEFTFESSPGKKRRRQSRKRAPADAVEDSVPDSAIADAPEDSVTDSAAASADASPTPPKQNRPGAPLAGPDGPGPLHAMMDDNFLQYASYVICDRAIPAVEDGLKPVQRRILHALWEKDDGRFTKVANIVGHTMQYHPHGDRSIGDALVNIVNKGYLIEGQGNFGNIFTGDPPAASRYIECRLTELARKELFNKNLTQFVDSYDRRNKEPMMLPCKLPLLLMLGAEGIAVGISTRILPHNFRELLEAQIAIIRKQPFELAPDFPQGGLMDLTGYNKGHGTVRLRARIKPSEQKLVIHEIPWGTTTESLISSIEDAVRKKKVPVKAITDYTAESVSIELTLTSGANPAKAIQALYAFTSCETKAASHIVVLKNNRPVEMDVDEVLRDNTQRLLQLLEQELKHRKKELLEEFHRKTLIQIFVENRLYQKIEECQTYEDVQQAVLDGLIPFRKMLKRDVTKDDVERLLEVRIRRISRFDINKNRKEIDSIVAELETVEKNLGRLKPYAIRYLQGLLKACGEDCPRRTQITSFEEVEVRELTATELTLKYDSESGYLGYAVEGEPVIECSSLDKIFLMWGNADYKVIQPPEKLFVDKNLIHSAIYDRDEVLTLVYWYEPFHFIKRFTLGGVILNKDYRCAPQGAEVTVFSADDPEEIYVKYKPAKRQRIHEELFHPRDVAISNARARGCHMTAKPIARVSLTRPRWWKDEGQARTAAVV